MPENDLSPSTFIEYLIIAVLGGAAATAIASMVLGKEHRTRGRILFVFVVVFLALLCYFIVHQLNLAASIGHPASTPLPYPSITPAQSSSVNPTPTPSTGLKETPEEAFVQQNIAPLTTPRKTGQWAVVIAESGGHYPKLLTGVFSTIAGSGHPIVTIFRPSASRGAAFDALFSADPVLIRRLREYCDEILVGKVTSSNTEENPNVPGLLNVTLSFDGKIISTSSGDVNNQFQASATGAGVNANEARTNAEDRLAASLTTKLRAAAR